MRMLSNASVVVRDASRTFTVTKDGSEYSLFKRQKLTEVEAVKPLSFVAHGGESIGVLGQNGSGKSTLLALIAGNEELTTGEIYTSASPSLLSVSAALQPHLTGLENAKLGLLTKGLTPSEAEELALPTCEWADIGDAINRPLSTYSSGMGARLKFAISTALSPEILLVDEALATGDASFNARAQKRMDEFLENAATVFIVSHSDATIVRNCTRALWLHEGELIADGPARVVAKWYRMWGEKAAEGDRFGAAKLIRRMQNDYEEPLIVFDNEAAELLNS